MPLLLAALVAYYLVYRFGDDILSAGSRLVARTAHTVADAADRLDQRVQARRNNRSTVDDAGETDDQPASQPRSFAGQLRDRLRGVADRLRSRPAPTEPRTAAGQRLLWEAGEAAAGGLGALITWVRLVWVDAAAAAESARQRREQGQGEWRSWPTGDDPQAPIKVTAQRLDREPTTDTDPADLPQLDDAAESEPEQELPVIDAEVIEDTPSSPAFPQLSATPVAALPSGSHDSGGHMDTTVAESGLGAYLAYSADMASSCDQAVSSAESTLSALSGQDWSGAPVDALADAMEHLGAASAAFQAAHAAFQAALAVRDAYGANTHAGTKDSVMAD